MSDQQTFTSVEPHALLREAAALRERGCRLVQISGTRLAQQFELIYSFEEGMTLHNLRVHIDASDPHVPSITGLYWGAFLYENELHDLFGIAVDGIAVDFKGNLYHTAVEYAFSTPPAAPKVPAAKPAPTAAPAGNPRNNGNSQPTPATN